MSTQAPVYPNQVGFSVFGSISAVVNALATTIVTVAVKANEFTTHGANMLINAAAAGEHITSAGEKRAKIYSDAVVKNGELSERESELKLLLRLRSLERQEVASRNPQNTPVNQPVTGVKITNAA